MMPELNQAPCTEHSNFEDLIRLGRQAADQGRLEDALEICQRALHWAEENGGSYEIDRAWCNYGAAAIELGQDDEVVPRLREILMRNQHEENCFLAAYNVARVYELRKEFRKALFYARIGKDRALRLERAGWRVASHNQMGNILLAESFFDEAREEFEQAMEYLSETPTVRHGMIYDNLGYCAVVQQRYDEGFRLLYRSLRLLRRLGATHYHLYPHMSLCYAHLEVGRLRDALRHGLRALEMAQDRSELPVVKNCLYMIGEAYLLAGDTAEAQRTFDQLQQRFYPDQEFLTDFLLAVDIRGMINLRA